MHILFAGLPGVGKTTLTQQDFPVITREHFRKTTFKHLFGMSLSTLVSQILKMEMFSKKGSIWPSRMYFQGKM
jgi:DNA polymerase III delta prime subunit